MGLCGVGGDRRVPRALYPHNGLRRLRRPGGRSSHQGGHADAVEVMEQTFREPFAAVSFLSGILYYVGIVLTGVAVWRSETLWRWGGLLT